MNRRYTIDKSAILYLAQMDSQHTNSYRFAVTMTEPVCPERLQQAADRIYGRFPTVFAGFCPGFFQYSMEPAAEAPRVRPDSGLLHTMSQEEIRCCAYRIFYRENQISIEAFHALTDGYGAMASIRALLAEYLYLCYGMETPERSAIPDPQAENWTEQLRDVYPDHAGAKPFRPRNRHAYQVHIGEKDWTVRDTVEHFSTNRLLAVSRKYGVSMTALLSTVMAQTIMEIQKEKKKSRKLLPVRIMLPIDLRRQFPSRTYRNFILYALPTLEPDDLEKTLKERLDLFQNQLKAQSGREYLAGQIAANVNAQRSLLYRLLPRGIKRTALRIAYRFFGECNSSITLTNLGNAGFSEEMGGHVKHMEVFLTPRRNSPYNCSVISAGEDTGIAVTRFGASAELEALFFRTLHRLMEEM